MPLIQYSDYKQEGGGFKGDLFQKGYGLNSYGQHGYGIGSIVRKIYKSPFAINVRKRIQHLAKPLIKKVITKSTPYAKHFGKKLANSAVDVGKEAIKDLVINKKPIKEVAKQRKGELKRKLVETAKETLDVMRGSGYNYKEKHIKLSSKKKEKYKNLKHGRRKTNKKKNLRNSKNNKTKRKKQVAKNAWGKRKTDRVKANRSYTDIFS